MRILLTGGGTGGHFYPLIAVAEELYKIADQQKIVDCKLYFMSDAPYDKAMLFDHGIDFIPVSAGKLRLYSSHKNIGDIIKTAFGCIEATLKLFFLYPDVIFAKGGYASFPALFAARILRIPVVIHDSDTVPGRVNIWAASFARRIALSYTSALPVFEKYKNKTAVVGQPIRASIIKKATSGMFEYFNLDKDIPTVLILGGSQGAQVINNIVLDALPMLLPFCQIIHQTGQANVHDVSERISIILKDSKYKTRYTFFAHLNDAAMYNAAGCAAVVVTRAGSTLFEVANWGVPAIVVPIPQSISRDQHTNAFDYARTGAALVIEENNFTASVLESTLQTLISDTSKRAQMGKAATAVAYPNAAHVIATELISIALEHE